MRKAHPSQLLRTIKSHRNAFDDNLHNPLYFRTLGRANMLRRLKVKTFFFLVGLGVFDFREAIGAMILGATSIGPSGTLAFCFFGERSTSFSSSSSESARRRFLLGIPCGIAGRGAVFSLSLSGKLPGMLPRKMLGRTCRTLAWPGDGPNPLGGVPKSMVRSLRK